jgi:diacylglycerol O-acyltransferase / wax synthase
MTERLSSLDASFLQVETDCAHMHVGWVALFDPPAEGHFPSFEALRDHIGRRLCRAPRYRQKLAPVPLGLHAPLWVDDPDFDLRHHVRHTPVPWLAEATDAVLSSPLERDKPLWELWIANELEEGRLAVIGKTHHCMVDGIAAVELAALLLDPSPTPPPAETEAWRAAPGPSSFERLAGAAGERLRDVLNIASFPSRALRSPGIAARRTGRAARALAQSAAPAPRSPALNDPISPQRHLARASRPVSELLEIKRAFGTTLNDVVLAVSAGAVRSFLQQRGATPIPLKAMVPVNVRDSGGPAGLGNRISFVFVALPCDEPDPVRRLLDVHTAMSARKDEGVPDGADAVLELLGHAPPMVQRAAGKLVASPRAFNLVVSNIPGPREPLYMLGCPLEEAYPVVPLADRHALSIGFTTIGDAACFGVYADSETLPEADAIAEAIDSSVDELLRRAAAEAPVA